MGFSLSPGHLSPVHRRYVEVAGPFGSAADRARLLCRAAISTLSYVAQLHGSPPVSHLKLEGVLAKVVKLPHGDLPRGSLVKLKEFGSPRVLDPETWCLPAARQAAQRSINWQDAR